MIIDTIVAQSTPYGRSGVGILRISGPKTKDIAYKILNTLPPARSIYYSVFLDYHGKAIDKGLAIWFPKPNSFTGEDVLELQGHGNPIILNLLIQSILRINQVRIARPGEFSERAFLNGKIDLIQAESIIKLINASSEASVKSSLKSLQGFFSKQINNLISSIIKIRVLIETILNFPEDDYCIYKIQIDLKLKKFFKNIKYIYKTAKLGKVHDGIKIVISGRTNVGKSTIFNLLSCKDSAIVTNIAGTTRDILYEYINMQGTIIQLVDTAGFRTTNNIIENIGIKKAWEQILCSDHVFFVLDNSQSILYERKNISNFINKLKYKNKVTILINKCDLFNIKSRIKKYYNGHTYIILSAKKKLGVQLLQQHLKKIILEFMNYNVNSVFLARQRHINILKLIIKQIKKIKINWFNLNNIELLAEDLKIIQNMLNEITGSITSDDILNSIFKTFCIGK